MWSCTGWVTKSPPTVTYTAPSCPRYALRHRIAERRRATWRHQDSVGVDRTPSAGRELEVDGCAYLRWLKARWAHRADRAWRLVVRLRDPEAAIRWVFGAEADKAISVAACESGDTDGDLSPHVVNAENGQYLGMFQMGSSERALYGHGSTPLEQARAAKRYHDRSGWRPWSCA